MANQINPNFKKEYEDFLCDYVLPLLGIDVGGDHSILHSCEYHIGPNIPTIFQCHDQLRFNISEWQIFWIQCFNQISEDDLALARRILQSFPDIAQYKMTGKGRFLPREFPYGAQKDALYKAAIQSGISRWLAGDQKRNQIGALFNELETWAVKTYEGKNVTMGFIINPDGESDFHVGKKRWLDFMKDDASAMLTDCIHSVIELDNQCNFIEYHSLSEENVIKECILSHKTPLRFNQVIQKYVTGKKCGIFLLNNGDIVLAKNQEVRFVRRNLRWLNLSYSAFRNALQPFVGLSSHTDIEVNEKLEILLENIFASVLDVSFSHAGGIIAVVGNKWPDSTDEKPILAKCDDLLNKAYEPETQLEDIRPLKRALLEKIIANKTFDELDRKLRGELLGLDGACILRADGRIHSFGAIIQNDSGSTGGGRGAAAKKLSSYGMAVKISTDGYIEVYIDQKIVYAIK